MSNPVEDAAKSGEGLLARIQHPIFGAFAGSWILWNWKTIYLLACGFKNPEATMDEVSKLYFFDDGFVHLEFRWEIFFLFPLLSTIFILIAGPVLHDGYILFKQWVNALINKVEPIPKTKYVQLEVERDQLRHQSNMFQGGLNLVRNKKIKIPTETGGFTEMDAEQVIQSFYSTAQERQRLWNENFQVKSDLAEAQKKIEELEKKKS